jgi:hypothetical protein
MLFSHPAIRSVSGNENDGEDDEGREHRKRAIERFRSGRCGVGRRHGLAWGLQVANEPADIAGLHWIGGYRDFLDVIAFGAVERPKFKSCRSRRDARQRHAHSAIRAAECLDREQRDCGEIIGHDLDPRSGGSARLSVTGRCRNEARPRCSSGLRHCWSILLTFRNFTDKATWAPGCFPVTSGKT